MSQHILVVEDDPSNARLFRLMCEGAGYRVSEAANGFRALELLRAGTFDLVLLDLQLPGLDGLGVARAVKAHADTARLPVVVATARVDAELQAALRAAGVSAILIKPFTRQALVGCLAEALAG